MYSWQVVRALEDDGSLSDLNQGLKPGHSSIYNGSSSEFDNQSYSSVMRKFRQVALGSQEYGSEYSGGARNTNGFYAANPSTSSSEY